MQEQAKTKKKVGRPRLKDASESKMRAAHMVRAYDDEWELVKEFMAITRKDITEGKALIDQYAGRKLAGVHTIAVPATQWEIIKAFMGLLRDHEKPCLAMLKFLSTTLKAK